ncbi:hypothetical protein EB118_24575, partial [bacterium]|nr:hypothetical protein [bacterium]
CDTLVYNQLVNELSDNVAQSSNTIRGMEGDLATLHQRLENKEITVAEYKVAEKKVAEQRKVHEKMSTQLENTVTMQKEKLINAVGEELVSTVIKEPTQDKRVLIKQAIDNNAQLSDMKKKELIKEAESFVNKSHGTLRESDAIQMFQDQFNVQLDTSQRFFCKRLNVVDDIEWYIGGKLDGIHPDNQYIVEVKNRTKTFFNSLRDYEKTQIYLYMYLTDIYEAKLVEKLKSKIRVTHIIYDQSYLHQILDLVVLFLQKFQKGFLSNLQAKKDYLLFTQSQKKTYISSLFTHTYEDVSVDCLINDLD